MSKGARGTGSRFLYEPFDLAEARIEAQERVFDARWDGLERRLVTIESMLERLDRRLWLAVYGVVGVVLVQGVLRMLQIS